MENSTYIVKDENEEERRQKTIYKILGTDKPTDRDFKKHGFEIFAFISGYIEGRGFDDLW